MRFMMTRFIILHNMFVEGRSFRDCEDSDEKTDGVMERNGYLTMLNRYLQLHGSVHCDDPCSISNRSQL